MSQCEHGSHQQGTVRSLRHTPQKKLKKCLTNHQKCDIIKIQMREARQKPARWQDPRESDKPLTIKSSTARGVGVRNTNVNQTVQAETMSRISLLPQAILSLNCKRLGFCPPPMNGVECQRIHSNGRRVSSLSPSAPFYFQSRAHGPGARYFYYTTAPAICQ